MVDRLFDDVKLDGVMKVLQQPHDWHTQKHTYSALYVDNAQWYKTNKAQQFLSFLRGDEFLEVVSRIFDVRLTDKNVAKPGINTIYFRLNATDFVERHADDSPGREVYFV